jgi:hypothetical protein
MTGFSDPILTGDGSLIRDSAHSPDYAPGTDGWTINQDGSAEFNNVNVRGTVTAGSMSAGSIGDSTLVNCDYQGGTLENSSLTFDSDGGTLLVYATTTTTQTFTASGSFTVPAGITTLAVECWGGGGGAAGGGTAGGSNSGGYGGGGGAYAKVNALTVTPGSSYAYVVGSGGSGASPNNLGGNGGASSFNSTSVKAAGGTAATLSATGKGGSTSSSIGDLKFAGGGAGVAIGSGGCGGGSSAGTASSGNLAADNTGSGSKAGASAVSGGGAGGAGGSANNNGSPGGAPGGGGGGGGGGSSAGAGGAGAKGQVRVTYTSAQTLIDSISSVPGTDSFGHSFPAGIAGTMQAFDPINGGPETWHNASYGTGWGAPGTPILGPSYRLTPTNNVEFRGGAANASAAVGQTIFTLPAPYRPTVPRSLVCWCRSTASAGGITVNTDGTVILQGTAGGGHTFEFDGLSFSLDS